MDRKEQSKPFSRPSRGPYDLYKSDLVRPPGSPSDGHNSAPDNSHPQGLRVRTSNTEFNLDQSQTVAEANAKLSSDLPDADTKPPKHFKPTQAARYDITTPTHTVSELQAGTQIVAYQPRTATEFSEYSEEVVQINDKVVETSHSNTATNLPTAASTDKHQAPLPASVLKGNMPSTSSTQPPTWTPAMRTFAKRLIDNKEDNKTIVILMETEFPVLQGSLGTGWIESLRR